METPRYKTIVSMLNATCPDFTKYIEMNKRLDLFFATNGASEANGGLEESFLAEFITLQNKLYKLALAKKQNESC